MLIKIVTVWLATDVAIIATIIYGVTTIRPAFPDWWRRNVADDDPNYYQ